MDSRRSAHGQTLTELALVLPCFCLGVFMAVQLICYCHNMIEIQRMAQVMIDRQSEGNAQGSRKYWLFQSLWGRTGVNRIKSDSRSAYDWRPFRGISTTDHAGWYRQIQVSTQLLPGKGFSRTFASVKQSGFAETYIEPPLPPES
jgi:hypothetical protein